MLISVDGQEHAELTGEGRTLGQVVDQAKALVAGSGRMIVGIECDGRTLGPDEVQQVFSGPADAYSQVNFQTSVPTQLARDALGTVVGLLDRIETLTSSAAEALNQSQVKNAMEHMGELCTSWNSVYQGVYNTLKLLDIDPAGIELTTGTAAAAMNRLLERLQEVKSSLENQDYTQLADILSYELSPLANDWRGIVDALLATLDEDKP